MLLDLSHLLASPTQKILAGVSADQKVRDRITVVGGLLDRRSTPACTRTARSASSRARSPWWLRWCPSSPRRTMFRATARVGKRLRSPVLEAIARHHRSDALSSVVELYRRLRRAMLARARHADAAAGLARRPCGRPRASCGRCAADRRTRLDQDARSAPLRRARRTAMRRAGRCIRGRSRAQRASMLMWAHGQRPVDVRQLPAGRRSVLLDVDAEGHGAHVARLKALRPLPLFALPRLEQGPS